MVIPVYAPKYSLLPVAPNIATYHDYRKMYYARNKQIAEACDELVALVADDRKGGTESTIKFAEDAGKKVILL